MADFVAKLDYVLDVTLFGWNYFLSFKMSSSLLIDVYIEPIKQCLI